MKAADTMLKGKAALPVENARGKQSGRADS
jgi:hypothetical protein